MNERQRTAALVLIALVALGAGVVIKAPSTRAPRAKNPTTEPDVVADAKASPTRSRPKQHAKVVAPKLEIAPADAELIDRVYSAGRTDFPDTELGRRLTYHMMIARRYGAEAELRSEQAMTALREQADASSELLLDAYSKADESRYFDRWLMVESLRELRSDSAVDALEQIATAPLPPEHGNPGEIHGTSTVDEELMIRATATRALGEIAIDGNAEARDRLLAMATNPDEQIMVRRAAAWGYASAYGDEEDGVEVLKQALPESEHVAVIHRAGLPYTIDGGVMQPVASL